MRLRFDRAVPDGGYAWWYVDGFDSERGLGITLIAFVGSVFSPFYFAARNNGRTAAPLDFSALNVSIHGPGRRKTWVFSEYSRSEIERDDASLKIGGSRLTWDAGELRVALEERTTNDKTSVRGTIRVASVHVYPDEYVIDAHAKHHWWPIAPIAALDVDLPEPGLNFQGSAYLDSNRGEEPLERAFRKWTWARFETATGTTVLYDTVPRSGEPIHVARRFSRDGSVAENPVAPVAKLPRTFVWAFERETRCDQGRQPKIIKTLEESPFYARSLAQTYLGGEKVTGVHESLSLDRFETPWMQWMLPYRIRRVESR